MAGLTAGRGARVLVTALAAALMPVVPVGAAQAVRAAPAARAAPVARATPAPARHCPHLVIYAVPGGPRPPAHGMGTDLAAVVTRLERNLKGITSATVVRVNYPAVPVLDGLAGHNVNGVSYPRSRARGAGRLRALLSAMAHRTACPGTLAMLAGSGQGADVIGSYLNGGVPGPVRRRIAAVALLSDPRFNPVNRFAATGSYLRDAGPVLAHFGIAPRRDRPAGARPRLREPFASATVSACNRGDFLCSYTSQAARRCVGSQAWRAFTAAIRAGKHPQVPVIQRACAAMHYPDPGPTVRPRREKATVVAVAHLLATKVITAISQWAVNKAPLPALASPEQFAGLYGTSCAPRARQCTAIGGFIRLRGPHVPGAGEGTLAAGRGRSWHAVEAPLPPSAAPDPQVGLSAVSCRSARTCVAVGDYTSSVNLRSQGLLLTGAGSAWHAIRAPLPRNAAKVPNVELLAVSCPPTGPCVAVGDYTNKSGATKGLLLSGAGTHWHPVMAPMPRHAGTNPTVVLDSVACVRGTRCVVVGSYVDPFGNTHGLLLTGFGANWHAARAPVPAGASHQPSVQLDSVACPPSFECVAAGRYTDTARRTEGVLLTRSGRGTRSAWKAVRAPVPPDANSQPKVSLFSASCPSGPSCVVVGGYQNSRGYQGLLLTRRRTAWVSVRSPVPPGVGKDPAALLNAVACPALGRCVITGVYNDQFGRQQGMLLHRAGAGWKAVQVPLPADASAGDARVNVLSVACASRRTCSAVGFYTDWHGGEEGLVLAGHT